MRVFLLTVFIFISLSVSAQETYSYINERTFKDPTDLIGYNFKPFKMEVPGDYNPKMVEAGEYSFGVTRGRLYVNGGREIAGLYEINNMEPTNYGYRILLLNSRNPSDRGHLKVILNKYAEAEAVVFKKEKKAQEIIFHLPDAKKSVLNQEKKYFTDLGEMIVEHSDSLWGQKIYPYIRVDQQASIQGRLYEADSTIITFEEVITIKEKKKKKKVKKPKKEKKKKKKRKKRKEKVEEADEEWGSLAEMNGETEEEKNEEEEKPQVPVEEKVQEEEIQEEIIEEDDEATAPKPEEEEVVVKRKVTKTYFVKVKTILKKEDGTMEEKTFNYPVKGIEEREDGAAKKGEEQFQLVIKSGRKKELYLYLNGDRTVSSMEIDGIKYLMRGH
ncbi:MAG: hypothetical protein AB8F94_07730 [Saprospiraceae bacterium]